MRSCYLLLMLKGVIGCVGPVKRDSTSRITWVSRVSGYRAGSRGDKLESADLAMFDYLSSRNVWGRGEWIFWLHQKGQDVETQDSID
jgi:hypothetical protein